MNTESAAYTNQGILHLQGGWPKDIDPNDVEHTIRFRKKVEKDEEYNRSVKAMGDLVEHCIKQNNAIDIYETYFSSVSDSIESDVPTAKTLNVFRDPNAVKRAASSIAFYPDSGNKIAVAYSHLHFQADPEDTANIQSYIWDMENPAQPDLALIPQSPLVCLKYSPKDPHILVGGSYNGSVAYWDTRKGNYAAETSLIEHSHRDPVYSVQWVQSKSGSEFFSVSTDGQVLWWDTRKLSEPTESMQIDPEKNGSFVGGTILDYEATMPTKFMVGGENGSIFMCNKKAKNPSERITYSYSAHNGPVYALQRNPFFTKNFLSVGDWTTKIWSEDVRTPILSTPYARSYVTDACWSPTRPALFATAKLDGSFDVWDLLFKQNEPCLTVQVGQAPLHAIKIQEQGRIMAVGARDGSTTLLDLSDSLAKQQPSEKAAFSLMLEREAKREKALESLLREKRLKQQAQQKGKPANAQKEPNSQMVSILQDAERDFFEQVKQQLTKQTEQYSRRPVGGLAQ